MANKMERFTQRARRVLSLAQEAAEGLHHNYIGTEHLLLGLMREEGGVAGRVLRDLGAEQRRVEELLERMTRASTRGGTAPLDLSPGVKRVLELAVDEARRMGHHYIGTEHILLGLVRQSEGVAIDVLKRLGVSPDEVRQQTRRVLEESPVVQTPFGVSPPRPIPAKTMVEEKKKALFDNIETGIHGKLLFRVLGTLANSMTAPQRMETRRIVEDQFSSILLEQSIMLSETERERLLSPLIAPFKSADGRRKLRFRITDKVTGAVKADLSISVTQARGLLPMFAEALKNGQTGKLLVMDDITERIEISIDDEQQAGAGTT